MIGKKEFEYSGITFDAKPDAVPYNYRISYKVTQICLIMHICCYKDTCSLIKLHMVSFAMISQKNLQELIRCVNGARSLPLVRFDPSVNKALMYAVAYGLVEQQKNAKYKFTERGKQLAEEVLLVKDLMEVEKEGLHEISKKLSENKVKEIVNKWRVDDAEN